jgi:hypothetical protein
MTAKTTQRRTGQKARRRPPEQQPVREVLYDRVTGRSQEVIILPAAPTPSRLTLTLRTDQRARLDQSARKIARTTGRRVSVAAIIRGALDAIMGADLDLAGCRNEADIRAAVSARLVRRR